MINWNTKYVKYIYIFERFLNDTYKTIRSRNGFNCCRIVDGVIRMYISIYWYNAKKLIMLECAIMIYIEGLTE